MTLMPLKARSIVNILLLFLCSHSVTAITLYWEEYRSDDTVRNPDLLTAVVSILVRISLSVNLSTKKEEAVLMPHCVLCILLMQQQPHIFAPSRQLYDFTGRKTENTVIMYLHTCRVQNFVKIVKRYSTASLHNSTNTLSSGCDVTTVN